MQGIYLRFFELLNKFQQESLPITEFWSQLNKIIKPTSDEKKENEIHINESDFSNIANTLTNQKTAVYASQANSEERKNFKTKLNNIIPNEILTEKEKSIIYIINWRTS